MTRNLPILVAAAAVWCAPHCTTNPELYRVRGQSGSEVVSNGGTGGTGPGGNVTPPGGSTVACPCGFPYTAENVAFAYDYQTTAMLRVKLLERRLGAFESEAFLCEGDRQPQPGQACARVRLRVEEVLAGVVPLVPGDEIEAGTDGLLPCFVGNDNVPIGAEALAQASWLPPAFPFCEARQACLDECALEYEANVGAVCAEGTPEPCRGLTLERYCGSACSEGFEETCPPRPPLSTDQLATRGSVRLTRWEDQILFASTSQAELRVPASQLDELSQGNEQCIMRFGDWSSLPGAFPDGYPVGG